VVGKAFLILLLLPVVAVFKGGRWYDPAQLYEAIGIKPFTR